MGNTTKRYSTMSVDLSIKIVYEWEGALEGNSKPHIFVNSSASDLSRLDSRFTVRFENRPGELASPESTFAHSACIYPSEIRRHLSKKLAIQSSSMSSGF